MKCRLISDDFSETSNAMDDAQSIEGKQIVCDAKCRICVKDIFGYFLLIVMKLVVITDFITNDFYIEPQISSKDCA